MADFDGVPWFVGGDAVVTEDAYRSLAYAALRGSEGITASADLKVSALDVPDAAVQVSPGVCAILLNAVGYEGQSYVGRLNGVSQVTVSPTGAGVSRSDLIVVRVEDPNIASESWPIPADTADGPYIYVRVISDIPPTTTSLADLDLGYDAIALARIDLPPSSAAVTSGMITDLRTMTNPRRQRQQFAVTVGDEVDVASPDTFMPLIDTDSGAVLIPTWATRAVMRGDALGLLLTQTGAPAASIGLLRLNLAGQVTAGIPVTRTSGTDRFNAFTAGTIDITSDMRGIQTDAALELIVDTGVGTFTADTVSAGIIDIEFIEAPA